MTTYLVKMGGNSNDSGTECATREEAEEAAMNMAREVAENDGEDVDSVDMYGSPSEAHYADGRCGDGGGWGACPANHDGAYYPVILIVEEVSR